MVKLEFRGVQGVAPEFELREVLRAQRVVGGTAVQRLIRSVEFVPDDR